ncbi:uncharacterized protein [Typha latifolia]|uniref:uncharacterized protein isoform X1 n=1 Tax=Typha latifolia TaxID=4733 RepID=UPI003C2F0AA5
MIPQHPTPGSGSSSSSALHYLNSPFGDTTLTKVFVGGLAWETQSESLRRHFEPFGDILEAVVIADKSTGRSKGYGFVTFRDPESARRACVNPSPFIDGRRANCNLASVGRPRPAVPLAHLRPAVPYFGSVGVTRGAYVGSSAYQQASPYNYQQSFSYPPHGCTAYGPEYIYQQNVYNPYTGQQYVQVYGLPGTLNTAVLPYGEFTHSLPGGHGYTPAPAHALPGHYLLQLSGPNVNAVTTTAIPAIQPAYPAGQPQLYVPSNLPFTQGIE